MYPSFFGSQNRYRDRYRYRRNVALDRETLGLYRRSVDPAERNRLGFHGREIDSDSDPDSDPEKTSPQQIDGGNSANRAALHSRDRP